MNPNDLYNPAGPRPGQEMMQADPMAGMGAGPAAPPQGGAMDPTTNPAWVSALMQQNAGAKNKMAQQMRMAQMMRQGGMDQLQGTKVGNAYAAPGLANLAASIFGSWRAGQMDKDAQGTAEGLDATAAGQSAQVLDALRRR